MNAKEVLEYVNQAALTLKAHSNVRAQEVINQLATTVKVSPTDKDYQYSDLVTQARENFVKKR